MNCKSCGKETTKIGDRHKKYCNLLCQREYEKTISKKNYPLINCHICQKEFKPVTKKSRYCSRYCKQKYDSNLRSKKPHEKKCNQCGTNYQPYTSLDKYCSANCRVENMKSKRTRRWNKESTKMRYGKKNPSYKHGLSVRGAKIDSSGFRLFRKNRDEYKQDILNNKGFICCERCGDANTKLEAHHIIFRSEKPQHEYLHSKQNIILVCVPCHNWFHKSKGNRNDIVVNRKLHLLFGNDVLDK